MSYYGKTVYMVHKGTKATLTYNKRQAVKLAKENEAKIRSLSYGYFKDCHFTMDYPTFYAVSETVNMS
jgi:predicted RNA-binding protein with EMAP domain